jgi:hypothetical protein
VNSRPLSCFCRNPSRLYLRPDFASARMAMVPFTESTSLTIRSTMVLANPQSPTVTVKSWGEVADAVSRKSFQYRRGRGSRRYGCADRNGWSALHRQRRLRSVRGAAQEGKTLASARPVSRLLPCLRARRHGRIIACFLSSVGVGSPSFHLVFLPTAYLMHCLLVVPSCLLRDSHPPLSNFRACLTRKYQLGVNTYK